HTRTLSMKDDGRRTGPRAPRADAGSSRPAAVPGAGRPTDLRLSASSCHRPPGHTILAHGLSAVRAGRRMADGRQPLSFRAQLFAGRYATSRVSRCTVPWRNFRMSTPNNSKILLALFLGLVCLPPLAWAEVDTVTGVNGANGAAGAAGNP